MTSEPAEAEIVHGIGVLAFTEPDGPRRDYLEAVHTLALEALRSRAALEASQRETQELTKERDRLIEQVTLLSVRAGRTEATDQACLTLRRERDQARRETQEASV